MPQLFSLAIRDSSSVEMNAEYLVNKGPAVVSPMIMALNSEFSTPFNPLLSKDDSIPFLSSSQSSSNIQVVIPE